MTVIASPTTPCSPRVRSVHHRTASIIAPPAPRLHHQRAPRHPCGSSTPPTTLHEDHHGRSTTPSIAPSPRSQQLFVTKNSGTGTITINTSTNVVQPSRPSQSVPHLRLSQIDPNGQTAYVANTATTASPSSRSRRTLFVDHSASTTATNVVRSARAGFRVQPRRFPSHHSCRTTRSPFIWPVVAVDGLTLTPDSTAARATTEIDAIATMAPSPLPSSPPLPLTDYRHHHQDHLVITPDGMVPVATTPTTRCSRSSSMAFVPVRPHIRTRLVLCGSAPGRFPVPARRRCSSGKDRRFKVTFQRRPESRHPSITFRSPQPITQLTHHI